MTGSKCRNTLHNFLIKTLSRNYFFPNSKSISSAHNINSNNIWKPTVPHWSEHCVWWSCVSVSGCTAVLAGSTAVYSKLCAADSCIDQRVRGGQLHAANSAGSRAVYSKQCGEYSCIQQTVWEVQLYTANSAGRTAASIKECGADSCIQQTVQGVQLYTANCAGRTAA